MAEPQTAPMSVAPAPMTTPVPAPAPKRSHKGLVLVLILFVLLVAGAVAYYYLAVWSQKPEKVMAKMYAAMQGVSSAKVDAILEGKGTGVSTSPLYVTEDDDGAAKAYDLMVETHFQFDDAAELLSGTLSFIASAEVEPVTSLTSEVRSIDDVDYVQLSSLTTPMIPAEFQSGIAMALNRWIVIDRTAIAKDLGIDGLLDRLETADDTSGTDVAVQTAFQTYLLQVITITETFPSEALDGVATHHYAYSVNKNAVGEMLDALFAATDGGEDFAEIRSFLGETNDITGELWIGKSDAMIYKLTADTTQKGAQQFALQLTVTLSDYGVAVSVEAPEDATPIGDLVFDIMEKVVAEANADDDGDGLQNSGEDKHGTDRANPDTDGDGYSDGAEVEGGYNPNGEGKLVEPVNG